MIGLTAYIQTLSWKNKLKPVLWLRLRFRHIWWHERKESLWQTFELYYRTINGLVVLSKKLSVSHSNKQHLYFLTKNTNTMTLCPICHEVGASFEEIGFDASKCTHTFTVCFFWTVTKYDNAVSKLLLVQKKWRYPLIECAFGKCTAIGYKWSIYLKWLAFKGDHIS